MSIDIIALLLLVAFVAGGFRMGLIATSLGWTGLILGVVGGGLLATALLDPKNNDGGSNFVFALTLITVCALIGQTAGVLGGNFIRERIKNPSMRKSDGYAGVLAGILVWTTLLWVMLPALTDNRGLPARVTRESKIAQAFDRNLPTPPDLLNELYNYVGDNYSPEVFDALKPAPDIGPPPAQIPLDSATAARVSRSTVRVVAYSCGNRIQEGSGFVIFPNLIVTNAHVIAGGGEINVNTFDNKTHNAIPVVFDSDRDLALLKTSTVTAPPLYLDDPVIGDTGATFGHPGGQESLRIAPAVIGDRIKAIGKDIYDKHRTTRDVLVLGAQLQQGDSGSALVDKQGEVVGIIFAIAPDKPDVAYALSESELEPLLSYPRNQRVSTGQCLTG